MAQRGQITVLAERMEISERWKAGQSDAEIAAEMKRSVGVVRKWRRKYQKEGRAGLGTTMGRPAAGALSAFAVEIVQKVHDMRSRHPGWGPLTIEIELAEDPQCVGQRLPSRSRIAAYLKQEAMARPYERHSDLPQPAVRTTQRAHEVWEMDAQGVIRNLALGSVSIINILDVHSRVKVNGYLCVNASHPTMLDYQIALRQAFVHFGMPEQVTLDHDCAFYDNSSASPYPLRIQLWLIALGVEVRFIEKPPPAEHSIIERSHQTVAAQAITGTAICDEALLQQQLSERLAFLNTRYPSRSLGGQAPMSAYPDCRHSGRPYRLEWEKDMLDMRRVKDYLAQGTWFRLTSTTGQFYLGHHRYGIGKAFKHQDIEITLDPNTCELVCRNADASQETRIPAKGITQENLMGELDPLVSLPAYQLELPFSPQARRQATHCLEMAGTTL